jgi:tripartite-type tricarboxylate transporter receptor subunit TctC
MLVDLLAGQLQVGIDVLTGPLPHIRTGALRALGMGSKTRSEFLPDVATIGETVPGYEANSWCGVGVPRGTPPEIIERLNREINVPAPTPEYPSRAFIQWAGFTLGHTRSFTI